VLKRRSALLLNFAQNGLPPSSCSNLQGVFLLLSINSSNILYPKEDTQNSTLMFECRTCRWSCQADTSCIYRNELTTVIGATAGVTQDVSQDPTVGTYRSPHSSFVHRSQDHDELLMGIGSLGVQGPGGSEGDNSFNTDDIYEGHLCEDVPDICMLCGEEITCDICGRPSYGGSHVLVDDLGRISSVQVKTSKDGNVGSFIIEQPTVQSHEQLHTPQTHANDHQAPSPPPSP
jgi:DNA-directed RNA polymerase subunit M/transcription elongation factor TFIIS